VARAARSSLQKSLSWRVETRLLSNAREVETGVPGVGVPVAPGAEPPPATSEIALDCTRTSLVPRRWPIM